MHPDKKAQRGNEKTPSNLFKLKNKVAIDNEELQINPMQQDYIRIIEIIEECSCTYLAFLKWMNNTWFLNIETDCKT